MNRQILLILNCLLMYNIAFLQTPTFHNDPHWKATWSDDFNTFDNTKWVKADYCDHGGAPHLHLKENVWVANGCLVIRTDNNKVNCPSPAPVPTAWSCGSCKQGIHNYTSGYVESRHTYNTRFGYIEGRFKLPYMSKPNPNPTTGYGYGLWPSFWTFIGDGVSGASNVAEIDIFEMLGKLPSNTITTNTHRFYSNDVDHYQETVLTNFTYTDWHTYSIEWDANKIIWYVDGKIIRTLTNHNIIDPIRIILGNGIDKDHLPPTSPSFTEYMYVDYIKVYQLKCDKYTVVNEISNFNTYNYAVKKSITLSGATTIPKNSNIFLRATDFIELKPGFEVPLNAELYLDINPCDNTSVVTPGGMYD